MYIFLKEFIRNRKQIGAITPSSKYLASKMLRSLTLESAHVVVELGAGTGVFTKKILERLNANAVLLIFETNLIFYKKLKSEINDHRVIFINDSAEKISDYLFLLEYSKPDYIISSLPLSSIPNNVRTNIVRHIHESLAIKGTYIQFQYSFWMLNRFKMIFNKVTTDFESFNFPPAFVFSCQK